jgi:hypothetical protein
MPGVGGIPNFEMYKIMRMRRGKSMWRLNFRDERSVQVALIISAQKS